MLSKPTSIMASLSPLLHPSVGALSSSFSNRLLPLQYRSERFHFIPSAIRVFNNHCWCKRMSVHRSLCNMFTMLTHSPDGPAMRPATTVALWRRYCRPLWESLTCNTIRWHWEAQPPAAPAAPAPRSGPWRQSAVRSAEVLALYGETKALHFQQHNHHLRDDLLYHCWKLPDGQWEMLKLLVHCQLRKQVLRLTEWLSRSQAVHPRVAHVWSWALLAGGLGFRLASRTGDEQWHWHGL